MKYSTIVFSSFLCISAFLPVVASDCTGDGCLLEPMPEATLQKPSPLPTAETDMYGNFTDAVAVEVVEVVPRATDNRKPLWDGRNDSYSSQKFDKTVDWQDGVPIWDDSISHYKDKNFSDWLFRPRDGFIYSDELDTGVRNQVEELLTPFKPDGNIWFKDKYIAQDLDCATHDAFGVTNDGCPFDTSAECEIWRKKPMVREIVSPRSPKIRAANMDEFIDAARINSRIEANAPVSAPLLNRYKMLMMSARACCTDGMVHALKNAGASDGLIYKFMSDDANFYGFGDRCLMMSDNEFDKKYPNTATSAVAADVRNGCLCRGRQWFQAMLAPFKEAFEAAPEFAQSKFNYTYIDGLQREITVSVNTDVKNVINQLSLCP